MKTFSTLFALAFAAVSVYAAEFTWPGWKCADTAKLEAALAAAPTAEKKLDLTILRNLVVNKVTTFEELCKEVDAAVEAEPSISADRKSVMKLELKKRMCLFREEYLKEAWPFCKANPSQYDLFYCVRVGKQLGLSDTEMYNVILDRLLKHSWGPESVEMGVSRLIDLGITAEVTTQKADLQKLNRKFSKNLLKDKTGWEPVIALIRTGIDTY